MKIQVTVEFDTHHHPGFMTRSEKELSIHSLAEAVTTELYGIVLKSRSTPEPVFPKITKVKIL